MYSKTNKPAFVAVCEIIKKLDIKEEEKLIVLANKDNWNGTTTKYSQSYNRIYSILYTTWKFFFSPAILTGLLFSSIQFL
ncbi:hypothetical protein M9Y11_19720, partial [Clostridioides difficile]|nr:hypothetical protein [Clostridioides difficile]